ncbi:hypothetical protein [Pusillimonas sp. ANT_WB101]|uniref:hypothetical protein n=1 Tax=Pusillimonas sp. ANT_WB101 TaxID=2597356 RepID=UPI00165E0CC7|nr:hypothetical protein [Pusillimonas sp. ANT_WB101]
MSQPRHSVGTTTVSLALCATVPDLALQSDGANTKRMRSTADLCAGMYDVVEAFWL